MSSEEPPKPRLRIPRPGQAIKDEAPSSAPQSGPKRVIAVSETKRSVQRRVVTYRCTWCDHTVCEYRWPSKIPSIGPSCKKEYRAYWESCRYARKQGRPEPPRVPTKSCAMSPDNLLQHTDHGWTVARPLPPKRDAPLPVSLIVAGTPEERNAVINLLKTRLGDLLRSADDAPEETRRKGPFVVFTVTLPNE
jgi:hypothetical protein